MAFAFVQSTSGTSDTNPVVSPAFAGTTTVGNMILVACVGDGGVAPSVTGVTDSKGNTYTKVTGSDFGNGLNMVAYVTQIASGKAGTAHTVTVAWNDAIENMTIVAQEFSGFTGAPVIDNVKNATGSSTAPASGATTTTARANEIIVGMLARAGDTASTISLGSGFTNLGTMAATDTAAMESMIATTQSSYNATFNLSVSRAWLAQVITIYDSADMSGGGGGPTGPTTGAFFPLF